MRKPLETSKESKTIKSNVTVWRPWQFKPLELFQGVAITTLCQQITQEYLLICIQSGTALHQYRNIRSQDTDGTLLVIEPGETWSCHSKDCSFHCLFIDPAWLQQLATELFQKEQSWPHFPNHSFFDPTLCQLVRDLAVRSQDPASRLQQEEAFLYLFASLLLSHAEDAGKLPQPGPQHPAINRAKEYLEANYTEEVTLQELAQAAYLSPYHLAHVFRRVVGLPPHAYQTQLRLARAKTLLTQGYDLGAVATETGFYDQSHFTQQFRRHYQVTPANYRKTTRIS